MSANSRSNSSCREVSFFGTSMDQLHQEVAAAAIAGIGHSPAPQRENVAGLRAGGNGQLLAAVQRGHLDDRPQGGLGVADGHLANQVGGRRDERADAPSRG